MSFLSGKKQTALAEVTEDGQAKGMEWSNNQMEKSGKRFQKHESWGPVPMLQIAVRVLPENESPFEARMEAGVSVIFLLKRGVRVQVQYDPKRKEQVSLVDDTQAILARNPQLIKKTTE